jgi:cleavage and polyadenylation specificity factor subunit 3
VENTLAKTVMNRPKHVQITDGGNSKTVELNMSVDYISFSAHSDYNQTSDYIEKLRPANIVSGLTLNNRS